MAKHVHGVYNSIAESYAAVLHLIGSGWRKEEIIVVMRRTVPVGVGGDIEHRNREVRQKNLLEAVFPLRTYSPEYFDNLSDADRRVLRPYLKDLDNGRIVLVLYDRRRIL